MRGPSNEITYAQIQTSKYTDAYSIVQAMHSNWMRTRGPQTLNGQDPVVLVYIDNQLFGGVDALRYVQLSNVQFIHYYDGNEATARWGLDHGAGVIYVSTDGRSAY
ncbi:MAG TPA: hypothetical protein VFL93_08155 [Longimicrobiaceae bacterium]|nr:hypothetical protein [Longimicrobiaceae bacterium]